MGGPRRTKRSSRQFGVSLPDEHLAFYHNNIRLGLAHPRSRDAEMDDAEDELEHDDELENQLASLGVDWDPAYTSAQPRAKTSLPYDSLTPRSRSRSLSRAPSEDGTLWRHTKKSRLLGDVEAAAGLGASYGALSSSERTVTPAMISSAASSRGPSERNQSLPRSGSTSPFTPRSDRPPAPARASPIRTGMPQPSDAKSTGGAETRERLGVSTPLTFNALPNQAQYLILNELIRRNSSQSTSVVLTALPAPEPATSYSQDASDAYLAQLQLLYGGGPPVLGVHAKTQTMTMSL